MIVVLNELGSGKAAAGYLTGRAPGGGWVCRRADRDQGYRVDPARGTCTCRAGQFGRPCKHVAEVRRVAAVFERMELEIAKAKAG